MSTGKRIMFAIMAWFVCHFTLHIAFAAVSTDKPPNGLIAAIDYLVAGAVYYWTGQKNKAETSIGENTEIEKIVGEVELRATPELKVINKTEAEMNQWNEKFIELLKSSISENGLNTIPGDDLIKIYNRAISIVESSNEQDMELLNATNMVLDEIRKRGLVHQGNVAELVKLSNKYEELKDTIISKL